MEIVKLKNNFDIDLLASCIKEDSNTGIIQAVKEMILLQKGFDITDPTIGVDWQRYVKTQDIKSLQQDIEQAVKTLPYILYVKQTNIENKNNGIIKLSITYQYITDAMIEKENSLTIEVDGGNYR